MTIDTTELRRLAHICKPAERGCRCSLLADEPSWKCEIHGGYATWPRRCECGRFVKVIRNDD